MYDFSNVQVPGLLALLEVVEMKLRGEWQGVISDEDDELFGLQAAIIEECKQRHIKYPEPFGGG
jgi:hypothetical protein